jgi:hypothetical protein
MKMTFMMTNNTVSQQCHLINMFITDSTALIFVQLSEDKKKIHQIQNKK